MIAMLMVAACSGPFKGVPVGAAAYPVVAQDVARLRPPPGEQYRLGPRDVLMLNVFGEPDMTIEELAVSSGGGVSIPLLGEVPAVGLTAAQVAASINQRLLAGGFLKAPHASVSVVQAVNYTFTLDGAVEKPGVYPIPGRLTLLQALAIGEGAARFARLDQIVVVREIDGQRYAARFDLDGIRRGTVPDLPIMQGDIVIVGYDAAGRLINGLVANLPAAAAVFIAIRQ